MHANMFDIHIFNNSERKKNCTIVRNWRRVILAELCEALASTGKRMSADRRFKAVWPVQIQGTVLSTHQGLQKTRIVDELRGPGVSCEFSE